MFFKNKEDIPESLVDQFVESEVDGVTGWQDKDSVELKKLAFNVKDENKKLKETNQDLSSKLTDYEKSQQEKIEQVRKEALEEARTKGDVKAIEERYQQQMADLEKRVREEAYNQARSEISKEQAEKDASSIADKIGLSLGIDEDDGYAIADLIRSRVKVDPDTQKEVYYDAKGGALSVDRDGFIAEIKKEARFKRLIKGVVTTNGGGGANGSGNGGAVGRKFDELTGAELSELRQKDQAAYERLRSEYYNG